MLDCFLFNYFKSLNTFQKPAHHCQLSSYQLTFQEGNTSLISGILSQLPFEQRELNPFKVYTWKLVYNNEEIFMNTTRTFEDGNLKKYAHIVISIAILILYCSIKVVAFHINCY